MCDVRTYFGVEWRCELNIVSPVFHGWFIWILLGESFCTLIPVASLISSVHILTSPGLSGVNMRMQSQSEYELILLWVANISWGKIKINRPRQRSLDSINNATPYYTGNNTVLVKSVYSRVTKFNVTRIANISAIFSISGSFV